MAHLGSDGSHKQLFTQAPWSPKVPILQVICSIKTASRTFHGVQVEALDQESNHHSLVWVFEDIRGFRVWQECCQRPFIIDGESVNEIKEIVGHHEDQTGCVYYAVKWTDYECPTWELEDDLGNHQIITEYCLQLLRPT
ncbi:hypothetical protein B0I35DRAFT_365538 [Stachybotrys elegans]|uniref:Chromo domain-containing protein n=1 Tax=Stachybotrys elegans TaxID=80388 RepID=A0A8K0SD84_9HYPO|nr:hypothetical protein B0I35DRAFT_365538 [Stachybotrys elegans]